MKIKHIISTLLFCVSALLLHGQSMDDAKSWYLEGRYAEALPVFRAEYLNTPDNAALNQWIGVSLLETGRVAEAEKHLLFASQKKITEASLYLGELYTKMYRFDEAEKEFGKYQKANRRNDEALNRLAEKRDQAERLKRMVSRTEDVQVIDSLVLPKSGFLAAYQLSESAGSLMPVNAFFRNLPANAGTLFMNERRDKIVYSQGDTLTGSDLFTMDKLLDNFGNEKKLPATINGEGNQAYPFVMSDGLTLYFASTGEPSLGGYDLFVTRYNLASDTYLTPNQLNMPFNSPFNDFMMALDEEKGIGWFASDRFQPDDSVCIYTFIPNPQVTLIENDDSVYMAGRAQISSIAGTWKEGSDYTSLRALARQKAVVQEEARGDFVFVINDRATYHALNDFKSSRAKALFSEVLALEKKWQALQAALAEKRDQFADGGAANNSLGQAILTMEKEADALFREIERGKIQARNEEVTSVNQ